MFGKATIQIPQSGHIGRSVTRGLSDELALSIGRTAARTLEISDGFVIVTKESGDIMVIGNDPDNNDVVIGHLLQDKPYKQCANKKGMVRQWLWDLGRIIRKGR